MMKIDTTFGHWVRVAPFTDYKFKHYTRPAFVADVATPENLDELTMGQLIKLSTLADTNESFFEVCAIVLDLQHKQVEQARAVDVVRFVGWVAGEAERINKLFNKTETKPTKEEEQAGIKKLRFGLFGMLDWYAKRMGIQNHDDVLDVPWRRVWRCLDMDNKTNMFQRRLQEVFNNEYRRKNQTRR